MAKNSKQYEAGVMILTQIFKDEKIYTNNSNTYSPTKIHRNTYLNNKEYTNKVSVDVFKKMFILLEKIGVLVKEGRGFVFNDKLKFKKSIEILPEDTDEIKIQKYQEIKENIDRKIRFLVRIAENYIEGLEYPYCSEYADAKHIIERMDFVSANKITKTIAGVACHYDIHTTQGNILSRLLLFSALETPCSIKVNINDSVIELHDVKVEEIIIDDEDIKIITSAIPLPISSFSDIKKIYNYQNKQDLTDDLKEVVAICSEDEELSSLSKMLMDS